MSRASKDVVKVKAPETFLKPYIVSDAGSGE